MRPCKIPAQCGGHQAPVCRHKKRLNFFLTLVVLGCQNYIKAWGRGQICPTIKNSKIELKIIFFKVFHCLQYIKIIIVMVGLAKEKLLKKKLRWGKNPSGGADLPPPQAN